jgi:hypothetical protein
VPDTNGHSNGSSHPFGDFRRRGRGNGSPFDGMAKSLPDGSLPDADELDEPIDLVAVQADDELISALAAGMSISTAGARAPHTDDQVVALLSAWRADVSAEPVPDLVDLDTAVAAVREGIKAARPVRSARARHLVPVAAAAAFLVLVGGGVSLGSADAQPDSALWPVSKMLFSERAASVEAAVRASGKIDSAKQALTEGKPDAATDDLQAAQKDLGAVRPQEGQAQLVDVKDFLVAKAAETPPGKKVDPASPLMTDRARPIPAGAALSQAPTAAGTVTPEPSVTDAAPTTATSHPTRTRPKPPAAAVVPPETAAPPTTPAAESPTEHGPSASPEPTTATPEGKPDTTSSTTTSSGMGKSTTGNDTTSAETTS